MKLRNGFAIAKRSKLHTLVRSVSEKKRETILVRSR